jgi:protein gp37
LHQEAGASRRVVPLYDGIVDLIADGYVFNGKMTALEPGHKGWTLPLEWPGAQRPLLGPGKPSLIFVVSMGDLFLEGRPDALIDRTLSTIAAGPHVGLVLSKRPRRMRKYFTALSLSEIERWQRRMWLGFSVENQEWFDKRWRHMHHLASAGWTVFCSISPMLGPVTLPPDFLALGSRGWVIVAGEEGRHEDCRDMPADWLRDVRDQCKAAGVPLFVKQMSRRKPVRPDLFSCEFPAVRSDAEENPT